MEKHLFTPDIFSRSHPEFVDISADSRSEISRVLEVFYPQVADDIQSVKQLSGLEINSRNYRISIGPELYALKRMNNKSCGTICTNQLHVSQQLLDQGIPFPRIIKNSRDSLVSVMDDGYTWVLAEFIEGDYFSGRRAQFFSVAHAIGHLQHALETIDSSGIPASAAAGSWIQTRDIIGGLFSREKELDRFFPQTESEALKGDFEYLKKTFQQIIIQIPGIRSCIIPTHIDLHPHNILISSKNDPVFVDVDSIQRADRIQSLAFSTFKLARQYVVHEGLANYRDLIALDTRNFVDAVLHNAGLMDVDIRTFPVLAAAEVLRRIAIIIQLNMEKGNREWNTVLHMHLLALHEIPVLFSDFDKIL
jgi:Ser/Thr protein kinase RdoA (MazF antagonist)